MSPDQRTKAHSPRCQSTKPNRPQGSRISLHRVDFCNRQEALRAKFVPPQPQFWYL